MESLQRKYYIYRGFTWKPEVISNCPSKNICAQNTFLQSEEHCGAIHMNLQQANKQMLGGNAISVGEQVALVHC